MPTTQTPLTRTLYEIDPHKYRDWDCMVVQYRYDNGTIRVELVENYCEAIDTTRQLCKIPYVDDVRVVGSVRGALSLLYHTKRRDRG